MTTWRYVLLTALALTCLSCQQEKRPDGFPKLYPCSILVTQENEPLADAEVALFSNDPALLRYPCGGRTNGSGTVEIMTYGFKGAPSGEFTVTVIKQDAVNRASSYEEAQTLESQGAKEELFDLVERVYADRSTSPLKITVSAGKNAPFELDVGAPVRESRADLMK